MFQPLRTGGTSIDSATRKRAEFLVIAFFDEFLILGLANMNPYIDPVSISWSIFSMGLSILG